MPPQPGPFSFLTTKSAWEQRSIWLQVCHSILDRDQTHSLLDNKNNGGNDHQVMVLPYLQE